MGQKLIIIIATTILLFTGLLLGYVLSQLVLGFLGLNLLTFLGTFSLIVIFGTLYYVLFWELRRQSNQSKGNRPQPATQTATESTTQPTLKPTTPRGADNRLQNKLIAMLDGDIAAAERLVAQARQNYPGMPESWYWERAIADLERDHR
ncbi:ABC transporter permease [Fischerella sp. JS2]|uniref:ABC transporter permease n=1 Tax=Fischerella sp. JS2 TaxID=2597771 RepID=UPI0028EC82CA|nr:ABC transporter permease [Fischerella sp. JS2]